MKKKADKTVHLLGHLLAAWFVGGVTVLIVMAAGDFIDLAWERLEGIGLPIVIPIAFTLVGHFVMKVYEKYSPSKETEN